MFAIAHLLGIDLMPRIRNWKDLLFFRPSRTAAYEHIDALFGEAGRNIIDGHLIETHFRDLMRVIVSMREGAISSVLLLLPEHARRPCCRIGKTSRSPTESSSGHSLQPSSFAQFPGLDSRTRAKIAWPAVIRPGGGHDSGGISMLFSPKSSVGAMTSVALAAVGATPVSSIRLCRARLCEVWPGWDTTAQSDRTYPCS
ncbi:Tn3 family transposase [Streptomyces sp. NPDC094022]|uniref:Tn3 family transposase n=1 Tax=Streptomyces sp. NPDC094022 TaxID=3155206 RepID=UPI00331ABBEF